MKYFNAFQLVVFLSGAPMLVTWFAVSKPFAAAEVLCIPLIISYVIAVIFTVGTVGDVI